MGHAYRRLHLIDIENLSGGSDASRTDVVWAYKTYRDVVKPGSGDQLIVASGPTLAPIAWFIVRDGDRRLLGRGVDGADRALIDAVQPALLDRYDGLVIGSGDRAFTDLATAASEAGLDVTVVARDGTISRQLRCAAKFVMTLPEGHNLTSRGQSSFRNRRCRESTLAQEPNEGHLLIS